MSQLKDAIATLADITVSTTTKTPVVYSIPNATHSVRGTPARVIFPMQIATPEGQAMQRVSFSNNGTIVITWVIADLLLFEAVKRGTSIHNALSELIDYTTNYIDAIRPKMSLTDNAMIESIDYEWNAYEFPEGTENVYYGCLMTLSIKEIIE